MYIVISGNYEDFNLNKLKGICLATLFRKFFLKVAGYFQGTNAQMHYLRSCK